jgi:hypothetical protein
MGATESTPAGPQPDGSLVVSGTSLLEIAKSGTGDDVRDAVARGEPLNQVEPSGMCPLHIAAFFRWAFACVFRVLTLQ